jgi:hypothetical protein
VTAVSSSNPTVVPLSAANIQFGGSGASRALIIKPADGQSGTSKVRIQVKDGNDETSFSEFNVNVRGQPPTITAIADQTLSSGANSSPIAFTVDDKETFPGFLTVEKASSNPAVVPVNNIIILGSTGARTMTLLAGNTAGSSIITLTVRDGENQTAARSFLVTVLDNNTNPTITDIAPQTTGVNKASAPITCIVGDKETPVGSLVVTATSGNTTLVPNTTANIAISTSSSNPASRSIVVTPARDQTGMTLITVTVTDGGGKTASKTFALTVSQVTVANDFNGDGSQDIILQDGGGFVAAWFMSGDDVLGSSFLSPNNVGDSGWKVVGAGDFNADGKPDMLYQHTDGSLAVWFLNGVTMTSSAFLTPVNAGGWKAVGLADFNKDGKVDILFQHPDSSLAIWYMDGTSLTSVAVLRPGASGAGWAAVAVADFDGDSNVDIIFQHTDGTLAIWYLIAGNNLLLPALLNPQTPGDANWRVVGCIDLNGDAKPDLLLQNRADNTIAIWYMNKANLVLGKLLNPANPGGTWQVVAP